MDSVLTRRWLAGANFRSVIDHASIAVVRDDARTAAADLRFDARVSGELSLIVSELGTNQLRYARHGRMSLREIPRGGRQGLEVVALDRGDGIADPSAALAGVRRSDGLGAGVPSVVRLSDEVDFDVRHCEGTCVRARKFGARAGRRREVAVLGRPFPGEAHAGDDAWFGRRGDRLILALADGLGHGGEARAAAARAIDVIAEIDEPPARLCERAHDATLGTRGTVLTIVEIDEQARTLRAAGVGNIITQVIGPRGIQILTSAAAVLGSGPRMPRVIEEEVELDPHDTVVMFSDGISARARIDRTVTAFQGHALAIADHMMRAFGRSSDDATVIVAK